MTDTPNNYVRPDWINNAPEQYRDIFENHDKRLKNIEGGEGAYLAGANLERAYLAGANLAGAYLAGANLERANLERANLERAYLAGANLERAYLAGANLERANLERAYLAGAYLAGANLERANLAGANLERANLAGANLERANLAGANLERANLAGANLAGANLAGANLAGANLAGANLERANLERANLERANLAGANLDYFKTDFIYAILKLPTEIPNLRQKFIVGGIDGSTYSGECACLAGTIARHLNVEAKDLPEKFNFPVNFSSPREQFAYSVREGDTPENNQVAKLFVEWIDEALGMIEHIKETK